VPATWALGKLGSDDSVDSLILSLKDTDWYVRWGAADALGKIGVVRALEPLTKLKEDADEYVHKAAEDAITKIHTKNKK
jgi:HEAT repeat protein